MYLLLLNTSYGILFTDMEFSLKFHKATNGYAFEVNRYSSMQPMKIFSDSYIFDSYYDNKDKPGFPLERYCFSYVMHVFEHVSS